MSIPSISAINSPPRSFSVPLECFASNFEQESGSSPLSQPSYGEDDVAEVGWIESAKSLFFESERPDDFEWKIDRYHAVLTQLQVHALKIKDEIFQNDLEDLPSVISEIITFLDELSLSDKEISLSYLESLRLGYQTFIKKLRTLGCLAQGDEWFDIVQQTSTKISQKSDDFFLKLSEAFMTQLSLSEEACALIEKFRERGEQNYLSSSPLIEPTISERLTLTLKQISNVPGALCAPLAARACNSVRKHWANVWLYDPFTQSNIPQFLGTINKSDSAGSTTVNLIAFGTPTIEGEYRIGDDARVTTEFLGFLLSYKAQKKSHLYFMLQDMRPALTAYPSLEYVRGGVEHGRVQAILEIASNEKYAGALFCVVRSKNSPFYYQNGPYDSENDTQTFIKTLLEQEFEVDSKESGNYFSPQVIEEIPDLRERAEKICQNIAQSFFLDRTTLTKEERQIFLDLYEDELVCLLVTQLEINSLSFGCKDTADRSGASVARFVANLSFKQGITDEAAFTSCIEALAFSRALMVCKRPPFKHRIDRAIQSIDFMDKYREKLKQLQVDNAHSLIPVIKGLSFDLGVAT